MNYLPAKFVLKKRGPQKSVPRLSLLVNCSKCIHFFYEQIVSLAEIKIFDSSFEGEGKKEKGAIRGDRRGECGV